MSLIRLLHDELTLKLAKLNDALQGISLPKDYYYARRTAILDKVNHFANHAQVQAVLAKRAKPNTVILEHDNCRIVLRGYDDGWQADWFLVHTTPQWFGSGINIEHILLAHSNPASVTLYPDNLFLEIENAQWIDHIHHAHPADSTYRLAMERLFEEIF